MTAIYICIAIISYLLIYLKSKDFYHPLAIASLVWFTCVAIASFEPLYIQSIQSNWSIETHAAVLIAGGAFFIPSIFSLRKDKYKRPERGYVVFGSHYRVTVTFLMFFSICVFMFRFYSVLFKPPLLFSYGIDAKHMVPDALVGFNYIELLTPFLALFCVFELFFSSSISIKRKVLLYLYIFYYFIVTVFYKSSRGELIPFLFGVGFIYFSLGKTVSIRFVAYVVLFILGLGVFNSARLVEGSAVTNKFGGGGVLEILSSVYTYVAYNFENLNKLTTTSFNPTYYWGGGKFFLKFFFPDYYSLQGNLIEYETLFFNARTYIYYFYHDLGLVGVAVHSLLISSIVQKSYNLSLSNPRYIILVAGFQKAIVFLFFSNYFYGEFVILFPYLVTLLLILMLKSKRTHNI
ncbi:O-antigen polymerase [Providencia stuartii]|uniref:O-antigen polymerase n=1 Tax=Providencia stuartii TaxID=588 RepID=UPI0034E5C263